MQIKVFSSIDHAFVTVMADATTEGRPTTVRDVLQYDAVKEAFPDLDLEDNTLVYNGEEIPEGLKHIILSQPAKEGDEYAVDAVCVVEQEDDDDDDDDDDNDGAPAAGAPGRCTVITNGGFVRTTVSITSGVTTLREVVFSEDISHASGYSTTQLSNCDISQNDENRGPDSLDYAKVTDGDVIRVSLRVSKEGGRQ